MESEETMRRRSKPWGRLSLFCAAVLLALGLFLFPLQIVQASSAVGTGNESEEIEAAQVIVAPSNGQNGANLTDRRRASSIQLIASEEVNISCETPFSYIYVVWDYPPGPWELETPGATGAIQAGQHGFLHELVSFTAPVTEVILRPLEGEYTLCDLYLFTAGTLPDWVHQWQPPLDKADLLVLPTHADDEHLFFGGTLPVYAGEREMNVQVVYLTNHFGEPYRPHELLNGLWAVGVTNYPIMSAYPDLYADSLAAAQGLYDQEDITRYQVEILRRFKPEVIVAHDINGEYGHGVHILNAVTLLDALELAPDESFDPASAQEYGVWDVPKTYLHLWAENQVVMDWDQPLSRFDGKTAFEMAVEGFSHHASQQTYFAVEQWGPYDCRLFGLARTTVGPDVAGGDFFENIDLTPEPEPLPVSSVSATISSLAPASAAQEEKPTVSGFWLILAGIALLAVFVCVVVVLRTRAKRRRRQNKNLYKRQ